MTFSSLHFIERAAILEISNTQTEWDSSLIKTRITEALRRVFKTPDYIENPDYAGAILVREVVAAFNDLPEVQAYVVRVFTARGVMPGHAGGRDR